MKVTKEQLDAILALPGPKRYSHFIKVVSDWEEVWGLYDDGWAMAADDDNKMIFPFWPAQEYAQACAEGEWVTYKPESMELDYFLNDLLPRLEEDNVLPCIFFHPKDKGVIPSFEVLKNDLLEEISKYE